MKKLVIYGAQVPDTIKLIDAINETNFEWNILGFIDDRKNRQKTSFMGHHVLGTTEILPELTGEENIHFFVTHFESPRTFKKKVETLKLYNCKFASLIHPSINLKYVKVGEGCQISEGCNIGANVEIGNFVTIRLKSLICHNAKIEDYTIICPNATIGSISLIKEGCFISTSATVLRTKIVNEWSTVGAGAVVVKDVPPNTTVVGIPAKKIKKSVLKRIIRILKNLNISSIYKKLPD